MRVQPRAAPPRGSGCGCLGTGALAGVHSSVTPANPPRRVAAPSPRTARPRDPAAGPGKLRSAGTTRLAGPPPSRPPPRHPGVRPGPASRRSCSLERPPGRRHPQTGPSPRALKTAFHLGAGRRPAGGPGGALTFQLVLGDVHRALLRQQAGDGVDALVHQRRRHRVERHLEGSPGARPPAANFEVGAQAGGGPRGGWSEAARGCGGGEAGARPSKA